MEIMKNFNINIKKNLMSKTDQLKIIPVSGIFTMVVY
jgi:hypothetical protein